jgi:catechol 2,3-dioxygenase-like lactoylglutathione lyase family enzyme
MEKNAPKVVGPGFIAITVSDVARSADFYEKHLGAVRDPYNFGPTAVAFLGWPALRGLCATTGPTARLA